MRRLSATFICLVLVLQCFSQHYVGKKLSVASVTDSYIIYNVSNNDGALLVTNDEKHQVVAYTDHGDAASAMANPIICQLVQRELPFVQSPLVEKTNRRLLEKTLSQSFKPFVKPLLKDKWHQYYEPYTLLTPRIDSKPCVAGCVAQAMAQVMHFWQYPEHGNGSHTYIDSLGCNQTLSADFESHYYDWENMLDNYEGVSYSDTQGYAVAQLLSDCGVSVNTKYGVDASGASSVRQPLALSQFFGYDKGAQMYFRDFYTIDEWTKMLKSELSAGRPVLMSGYHMRLGHAFVCDGYDERDYFHFSFGNPNGEGDGYFYLPYLTPDFPPTQKPDEPENGFNLLQSIIMNVMPETHPNASGKEVHAFAFSGIKPVVVDSVSKSKGFVVNRLGNVGWNLHNDSVAIVLKQDEEIVSVPYVYDRQFLLEELDDTVYTDTIPLSHIADVVSRNKVPDGLYKLVPAFKDNGLWEEARTSISSPNYLFLSKKGSELSLFEDESETAYLTMDDVVFPDWLLTGTQPDYTLTIHNHNTEFCGRVYILLENVVDTLPSVLLHEQGLTLAKDEVTRRRFYHTRVNIPEGTYYLRFYYESDLFSSELNEFDGLPERKVVVSKSRPVSIDGIETCVNDVDGIYSLQGIKQQSTAIGTNRVVIRMGKKYMSK